MTNKLNEAIESFKTRKKELIKDAGQLDHDAEIEILDYLKVWVKEGGLNHAKIEAQQVFIESISFFDREHLLLFEKWVNEGLELYSKEEDDFA